MTVKSDDDAWWPRHDDGRRKTVGEMTSHERIMVFSKAGEALAISMVTADQQNEPVPTGAVMH